MTEYKFHSSSAKGAPTPSVRLEAGSPLHGAAVALRQFIELGCDIGAPLAHLDLTEPDGTKHTILVDEVLNWLSDPARADFIHREGLAILLR